MANISIDKKFNAEIVVDKSVQDHGNDSAAQQKAKKAVAFLKKHGVPKSLSKKK